MKAIKVRTISKWLDDDITRGEVKRIIGVRNHDERGLYAIVELANGERWEYHGGDYLALTGEIAREVPTIPTFVLVDEN